MANKSINEEEYSEDFEPDEFDDDENSKNDSYDEIRVYKSLTGPSLTIQPRKKKSKINTPERTESARELTSHRRGPSRPLPKRKPGVIFRAKQVSKPTQDTRLLVHSESEYSDEETSRERPEASRTKNTYPGKNITNTKVKVKASISKAKLAPSFQSLSVRGAGIRRVPATSAAMNRLGRCVTLSPYMPPMKLGPAKTQGSVAQRVASAKRMTINDLKNRIKEQQLEIESLRKEATSLKHVEHRHQQALRKWEGRDAELPQLILQHKEELRNTQLQVKKISNQSRELELKLKQRDKKIVNMNLELRKLKNLCNDAELEERSDLHKQLDIVSANLCGAEKRLKQYQRHVEILDKNHNHQINVEKQKLIRANNHSMELQNEIIRLKHALRDKDRMLNYIQMRSSGRNLLRSFQDDERNKTSKYSLPSFTPSNANSNRSRRSASAEKNFKDRNLRSRGLEHRRSYSDLVHYGDKSSTIPLENAKQWSGMERHDAYSKVSCHSARTDENRRMPQSQDPVEDYEQHPEESNKSCRNDHDHLNNNDPVQENNNDHVQENNNDHVQVNNNDHQKSILKASEEHAEVKYSVPMPCSCSCLKHHSVDQYCRSKSYYELSHQLASRRKAMPKEVILEKDVPHGSISKGVLRKKSIVTIDNKFSNLTFGTSEKSKLVNKTNLNNVASTSAIESCKREKHSSTSVPSRNQSLSHRKMTSSEIVKKSAKPKATALTSKPPIGNSPKTRINVSHPNSKNKPIMMENAVEVCVQIRAPTADILRKKESSDEEKENVDEANQSLSEAEERESLSRQEFMTLENSEAYLNEVLKKESIKRKHNAAGGDNNALGQEIYFDSEVEEVLKYHQEAIGNFPSNKTRSNFNSSRTNYSEMSSRYKEKGYCDNFEEHQYMGDKCSCRNSQKNSHRECNSNQASSYGAQTSIPMQNSNLDGFGFFSQSQNYPPSSLPQPSDRMIPNPIMSSRRDIQPSQDFQNLVQNQNVYDYQSPRNAFSHPLMLSHPDQYASNPNQNQTPRGAQSYSQVTQSLQSHSPEARGPFSMSYNNNAPPEPYYGQRMPIEQPFFAASGNYYQGHPDVQQQHAYQANLILQGKDSPKDSRIPLPVNSRNFPFFSAAQNASQNQVRRNSIQQKSNRSNKIDYDPSHFSKLGSWK